MKDKITVLALGIFFALCAFCIFSNLSEAKRLPPKNVEPVIYNGIIYTAPHNKMGYIEAWNLDTGEKLWELKVYDVDYDSSLESDVQDVFITSLSISGDKLIAINEKNDKYEIGLKTKEVNKRQSPYIVNDFKEKFSQVKAEMSKEEVISLLGEPIEKHIEILPEPPFWGPSESLVNIINPGGEYEEWQYIVDDRDYRVFFGSVDIKPKTEWKVIDKTSFPKGAVF